MSSISQKQSGLYSTLCIRGLLLVQTDKFPLELDNIIGQLFKKENITFVKESKNKIEGFTSLKRKSSQIIRR